MFFILFIFLFSLHITVAVYRWPEKQNSRQETKWDLDPC